METVWNDLPARERASLDRVALETHFRPHAEQVLDSRENLVFVAEGASGEVAGYAVVGGASIMLSPVPFGFLYDLWVAPGARRQGIARRLVEHAAAWCRRQGYGKMRLEVSATNGAARALYAASGFSEERLFLGKALS